MLNVKEAMETLSYKDFREYCNYRACDGRWSMDDAVISINLLDEIEKTVKVKGFFRKKKRTREAKELAWKKLISELFSN